MAWTLGVLTESDSAERRLPLVPDVAKKFRQLGADVLIQRGAGSRVFLGEEQFSDVAWADSAEQVLAAADALLVVNAPSAQTIAAMKPGAVLLGMLQPYASAAN